MAEASRSLEVRVADLSEPGDAHAFLEMLDAYARDPFGSGAPLPKEVRDRLVPELLKLPNSVVFLAFAGEEAVGVANCYRGFSSFAARPLLNVHDLAVRSGRRGQGIGRRLLAEAERHARETGCCRMTLEVLERNARARHLYRSFGFDDDPEATGGKRTFFLNKSLGD